MKQFIKFTTIIILLNISISCNNHITLSDKNNSEKNSTRQPVFYYYNKKYSKLPIVLVRDTINHGFFNRGTGEPYPAVLLDTLTVNQCEEFLHQYFKGKKVRLGNKVRIYAGYKDITTDTIIVIQLVTKKIFYKNLHVYNYEQFLIASPFLKTIDLRLKNQKVTMEDYFLPKKSSIYQ